MTAAKKGAVTDQATVGIDLGGFGSAEVIPIASIGVDPDYQRDLRRDLVNRIAAEYDIVKAGPILVSQRADGSLWAVDGQHRMFGALQAGETEVFANVVHGLTPEQEAGLRLARNDRRSDTIYEKFRTRLMMGEPKAHRIVEIVRQNGTDVNLTPSTTHGVNAIAALEVLFDASENGSWLGRVLRVIGSAFREDDKPRLTPDTCSASMMKAVAWFLSQHVDSGEVREQDFIERLGSVGPDDVRRKAVSHKAAQGGAQWLNFYRALVEQWNFRRTEAKMIRWKTIGSISQLGETSSRTGNDWAAARASGRAGRGYSGG